MKKAQATTIVIIALLIIIAIVGIVIAIGIFNKPSTTTGNVINNQPSQPVSQQLPTPQQEQKTQISETKQLTTDEIKAVVYQAIRKYIPKSTIGGFNGYESFQITRCGKIWYYPSNIEDASKDIVDSIIYDCGTKSDTYTPEEWIPSNSNPSEDYIKTINNHKVLIHNKMWSDINREDYKISFACDSYWIIIYTQDFYGTNGWEIYKDYNIDKVAMENMVSEILEEC